MTRVYVTIDTEYSSGLVTDLSDTDRRDNFARSIACETPDGPAGITHKLRLFEQHGLKAVFFVDPMPALVWGVAAIEDVLAPILEAGQDIQLHCHTEWLAMAGDANPLASKRTGQNLFDFSFEDQCAILEFARDTLVAAGARAPVAFRAGNYGANDDTLRALKSIGVRYDTSHCPALLEGAGRISLGPEDLDPQLHQGMIEVPVGSIGTIGGGQRHAQITALTLAEMRAAIRHARDTARPSFTLVTHSFELINRRKLAVNRIVRRRFSGLCRTLEAMHGVTTANYRDNPPLFGGDTPDSTLLPASPLRTGYRYAEQLVSNTLYGAL
ncbi:MAG: polysaccharide deacetylase family protein [Erythrobacter sp.]